MRGEKLDWKSDELIEKGSPPHARGKALKNAQFGQIERITPACAGKSRDFHGSGNFRRDHPRMRGEKFIRDNGEAESIGSPPHARGKEFL